MLKTYKNFNLLNVGFLIIGLGVIFFALIFKTHSIKYIFQPWAMLIVGGLTFCAGCLSFSLEAVIKAFKSLKKIFITQENNLPQIADALSEMAKYARTNGILALSDIIPDVQNEFLKQSLINCIDEPHPKALEENLRTLCAYQNRKDYLNIEIFEELGGYSPTFGMIGAVIGLVQITANSQGAAMLLSGIATAFVATLYGLGLANLFFLPAARNLKNLLNEKMMEQEIIITSVLGIAQNQSPIVIKEKLQTFLTKNIVNPDFQQAA